MEKTAIIGQVRGSKLEEEEEVLYVCLRVADMPRPYVPCLKGKCKSCKEEVYYSKYVYGNDAFVKAVIDSGNLLCVQCATKAVRERGVAG